MFTEHFPAKWDPSTFGELRPRENRVGWIALWCGACVKEAELEAGIMQAKYTNFSIQQYYNHTPHLYRNRSLKAKRVP